MTKIVGVIQVRMGSARLPNKAMLQISNKSILFHIYKRLMDCKELDMVCIATSNNVKDDLIEEFAITEGIPFFRGSEQMVGERVLQAALKYKADAFVRITADCPLVDPQLIDKMVSIYKKNMPNIDMVSNTIERTFPDGLDAEVISVKFLSNILKKLESPFEHEWFMMHIIENYKNYMCLNFKNFTDLSKMRWTVDYQEDYEFIKLIYENFHKKNIFYFQDVLELIKHKPELLQINNKFPADTSTKLYNERKSIKEN